MQGLAAGFGVPVDCSSYEGGGAEPKPLQAGAWVAYLLKIDANAVDLVLLSRVKEHERVSHRVKDEAEALGRMPQVGGLSPDKKVEHEPLQLRIVHPGIALRAIPTLALISRRPRMI